MKQHSPQPNDPRLVSEAAQFAGNDGLQAKGGGRDKV
jgi:hypothetical protein